MRERKYTLPRHTNLAKQGSRTGAFFIDIAIGFAITLAFVFGCFNLIFKSQTEPCEKILEKAETECGLLAKDETGQSIRIARSTAISKLQSVTQNFYLSYLPGKTLYKESEKQKEHSVEWFNVKILEVDDSNKNSIFTFDGGDKNKPAIVKEGVAEDEAREFIYGKYEDALYDVFYNIDFVKEATIKEVRFSSLSFMLSSFIGFGVTYLLLPLILKDGQTVGKKVFKIGLANSDGYKFKNRQLLMRFMPFLVCDLGILIFTELSLYLVLMIYLIIFLVSFALAMASPKKMSLHDFTARTIVVDLKTSRLFVDENEEEKYLIEEDHILEEVVEQEYEGEEPKLKYEK